MKSVRRVALLSATVVLAVLGVRPLRAMMRLPTNWPVDRMVTNLGRYVEQHPDAAEAHYCLGRIHAYSFVFETAYVAVRSWDAVGDWEKKLADGQATLDGLARLVVQSANQHAQDPAYPRLDAPVIVFHLRESVRALQRALELAPENGAFHLTLAYVFERGAHLAAQLDSTELLAKEGAPGGPVDHLRFATRLRELGQPERADAALAAFQDPEYLLRALPELNRERSSPDPLRQKNVASLLQRAWQDRAIEHYRMAFERSVAADLGLRVVDDFLGPVSLEAGEGYLRLTESEPDRIPAPDGFRERVTSAVQELRAKDLMGSSTPIVLSLEGCHTLDELLFPGHAVLFDVDGDQREEPWPWTAPDTGWLVWDPQHTGVIRSGRSFFGTGSGWFFFPDGYRVLDALDDDRSGELRGPELRGVAVWFDRDSDGVSDRGEVVPVEELGIVALATRATMHVGRSLANPCGLELADGRILPTYDWVLAPVSE